MVRTIFDSYANVANW